MANEFLIGLGAALGGARDVLLPFIESKFKSGLQKELEREKFQREQYISPSEIPEGLRTELGITGTSPIIKEALSLYKTPSGYSYDEEGNLISIGRGARVSGSRPPVEKEPPQQRPVVTPEQLQKEAGEGKTYPKGGEPIVASGEKPTTSPLLDYRKSESFKRSLRAAQRGLEFDQELKEYKKQNLSLDQMQRLIDLTETGNTVSSVALGTKMARAMGEVGVLTESDVVRYVSSRQLSQKGADILGGWIVGRPTPATLGEIKEISSVLQKSYQDKVLPIYRKHAEYLANVEGIPIDQAFNILATTEIKSKAESGKKAQPATPITEPSSSGMSPEQRQKRIMELRKKLGK